jgi:hypothetical protein
MTTDHILRLEERIGYDNDTVVPVDQDTLRPQNSVRDEYHSFSGQARGLSDMIA